MLTMVSSPVSEQVLLARARGLAGKSVQQLAKELDMKVPALTLHAKGWLGTLLELALGADAGTKPEPDFVNLGIELKTLPLNQHGKPKESTYVCMVQLRPEALADWQNSLVRKKLTKVLWIPYEAEKSIPIGARHIGNPILWQPNQAQLEQLHTDWQELTDMIVMGDIDKVSAHMGKYLQIRPKAANAAIQTSDLNQPESNNKTMPRGFYLRTSFTHQVIVDNSPT